MKDFFKKRIGLIILLVAIFGLAKGRKLTI